MRTLKSALLVPIVLAVPALAAAQGYTASLVDLGSSRVVAHFAVGVPGDNPAAVAWAGNGTAYVVDDDGDKLVRLDMTASPPAITATYAFPASYGPHALAINPAGTRALVAGDSFVVYLLDLTTSPFTIVDTITMPIVDPGGIAFYSAGTKGVVVDENDAIFLDLSSVPAGVTTVDMGNPGHAVAINAANTRAFVTIDTGGLQTINLTTTPPTLVGSPVGPPNADPLGVAVSPGGTRVVYVDEETPDGEANVVDVSGTPTFLNSVSITAANFFSASAVAFNPATAAAVIATDDGLVILNAPYTAITATVSDPDPAFSGATTYSVAVNPAGTFAIMLNEDRPPLPNTASLLNLSNNTMTASFVVGDNPTAVAWAGNNTAYVVNDDANTLVRLDMTAPTPVVNATYAFPPGYGPHALAVNAAGTRALVSGDGSSVYLLDLTTTPFSVAATIPVPTADAGGVAFYPSGTKAIVLDETDVLFLDLSTSPPGVTTVSMGTNNGLAVAVNPTGTRAVVTIDAGGLQTFNLTTSPPSAIGGPVGPLNADSLGVAVSSDGTRAIYVDEEFPDGEANVVNISGAPSLVNTVSLSATISSPSAVAFNPVTSAALIAGDDGVDILNPPYTAINATITYPGFAGATAYSIAVNAAGTFAIVLNEDMPAFNQVTPVALAVDPSAGGNSNGNGVLEPGETVDVDPSWMNVTATSVVGLTGTATDIAGPVGAAYSIPDGAATYGTVLPGATANCVDNADCYAVSVSNPPTRPAAHWDVTFTETPNTLDSPKVWTLHVGDSFPDVPTSYLFYKFIENLFHNGVTGGCGGGDYCPTNSVTRAQMAVFLLKSAHGSGFVPSACTGIFGDVTCPSLYADWIEELFHEGITGGCGGGNYCPNNAVRRDQMAAFLLKAQHGPGYVPPACTGVFPDVACPSLFADWIEQLFAEGITGGCGGGNYCPSNPNTRGQMAVFLVKTFGLMIYRP